MKFTIIDNNKEVECNIIFTFKDDNNDINYIIYTDGTKDLDNELKIYASRYVIKNNDYILKPIENDYEWSLIDNMIEAKCKRVD